MFGQGSGRFRTTEFFGVVLPGFYLVLEIGLLVLAFPGVADDVKWGQTLKDTGNLWAPALVLLLLVSYLIGSVFRTWAIHDTDELCRELFPRFPNDFQGEPAFPYPERLRKWKEAIRKALSKQDLDAIRELKKAEGKGGTEVNDEEALREYLPPFGLSISKSLEHKSPWNEPPNGAPPGDKKEEPEWHVRERIYNFWKAELCVGAPSAFEFAQAEEARTRFFFGMFWAARWSLRLMFFAAGVLWVCAAPDKLCAGGVLVVALVVLGLLGLASAKEKDDSRWGRLRKAIRRTESRERWLAFWGPVFSEPIATVLFLWATIVVAPLRDGRYGALVLAVLLVVSSALLFYFLGTKLRHVRAREMHTVYLNYAAFVLASYRTAPSSASAPRTANTSSEPPQRPAGLGNPVG